MESCAASSSAHDASGTIPPRPPLTKITKRVRLKTFAQRENYLIDAGERFDLANHDARAFIPSCRSAEGMADAIGLLAASARDQQKSRATTGEKALYIIQVGDDAITKIGISSDPVQRLTELQWSHYRELFLWAVVFCPGKHAHAIEQAVLSKASHAGTRLMGEWIGDEPEAVFLSAMAVSRTEEYPVCDGRTWFENMVARTRQLYEKQRASSASLARITGR